MEVEQSGDSVAARTGEMEEYHSEREEVLDEASERKRDSDPSHSCASDVERKSAIESPPVDDCCPICFGIFVVPCRAPCGHWYCGVCILQYWNYVAALQPCKCPMCSQQIKMLTPETSLCLQQEEEVIDILKNVKKYNRLFNGGPYGLIQKVIESPLFIKRVFQEMMDPDRVCRHLHKLRILAIFLGAAYSACRFEFLPTGGLSAIDFFDYSAISLVVILYLLGLCRRRQRFDRVRQLAAADDHL